MKPKLLIVHALSPLHAGTGQSNGAIELSIARDRATGMPLVPGSSIKGALRAIYDGDDKTKVFGPETANASDHAGALVVGDANLLLLPVRSVAGTFAWVTSPLLLAKFARDVREVGLEPLETPLPASVERAVVCRGSALVVGGGDAKRVVFEDLDFQPDENPRLDDFAEFIGKLVFPGDETWTAMLLNRLCVVHDDAMAFLATHATDVVARVVLKNDTKTVANLWHEENLPAESVLVSLVAQMSLGLAAETKPLEKVAALLREHKSIQLGGKSTVGRGRCRLLLSGGAQ